MIPNPYVDIVGLDCAEVSLDGLLWACLPLRCSGELLEQSGTLLCLPTSAPDTRCLAATLLLLPTKYTGSGGWCSAAHIWEQSVQHVTGIYNHTYHKCVHGVCLCSRPQSRRWGLLSPLGSCTWLQTAWEGPWLEAVGCSAKMGQRWLD